MWEEVIEPACATFGLLPVRADRIAETGEIPDQIFTYLRDADVVIADVSHANPNVMYELGLRHSRPGITIQIGEYGLLPFDVTTIRTIQFNRSTAGLIGARNDLINALRAALEGGGTPLRATSIFNALVADAAPAAVPADVAKSIAPDETEVQPDEPGFLEVLAEGEEGVQHVAEVLGSASRQLQTIGALTEETTGELANASFAGRLQGARKLASQLKTPAEQLESDANDFYGDVAKVDVMVQYIVERLHDGAEDPAEAEEFLRSLDQLVDAAEEGAVGMTGFRNSVRGMRKIARDLEPVSKVMERAAGRILEGTTVMSQWRRPLRDLLGNGDEVAS
jgi:hypothetical protein